MSASEQRLTRREILKRGAGAVGVAGAAAVGAYLLQDPTGGSGLPAPSDSEVRRYSPIDEPAALRNYFAEVDFPPSNPRISIATGDAARVEQMVRAAVARLDPQGGMRRFVSTGDVVLIKPNAGFDRPPHLGATTHPEVLRGVIRLCKEAGAGAVLVADNPIEAPAACLARSGIGRVVEEEGARLVLPRRGRFKTLNLRGRPPDRGKDEVLGRWPFFYEPLAEATKLIGVAPVKDHNLAGASMSLKNWYGLLGGRRNQFHQAIHAVISDLALLISPTLVIADATRVMLRNGPTGGRLSDIRPGGAVGRPVVVASVDPVACDAWCYENLLGRDPALLEYVTLAARKIDERAASGQQRFGERDWRAYDRRGLVVSERV